MEKRSHDTDIDPSLQYLVHDAIDTVRDTYELEPGQAITAEMHDAIRNKHNVSFVAIEQRDSAVVVVAEHDMTDSACAATVFVNASGEQLVCDAYTVPIDINYVNAQKLMDKANVALLTALERAREDGVFDSTYEYNRISANQNRVEQRLLGMYAEGNPVSATAAYRETPMAPPSILATSTLPPQQLHRHLRTCEQATERYQRQALAVFAVDNACKQKLWRQIQATPPRTPATAADAIMLHDIATALYQDAQD